MSSLILLKLLTYLHVLQGVCKLMSTTVYIFYIINYISISEVIGWMHVTIHMHIVSHAILYPSKVKVSKISFKEMYTFIHQRCIKLIKSDNKEICNVTKRFLFQINAVLLNFEFFKNAEKSMYFSTKILSSTTVFNIAIVMMLKIQLCHHWNKLHFRIYSNIFFFK